MFLISLLYLTKVGNYTVTLTFEIYFLFQNFNYEVQCTGADAANQNGPIEQVHSTISNIIYALLFDWDCLPSSGCKCLIMGSEFKIHYHIMVRVSFFTTDP